MEQVQMINIQRLLEAAEYLERRERGNGGAWVPSKANGSGVRPHRGARVTPEKGSERAFAGGMVANPSSEGLDGGYG